MSCNLALVRKIVNYAVVILLFILISETISAQDIPASYSTLLDNLKRYFHSYYFQIKEEGIIKPKEEVFEDIKEIVKINSDIEKNTIEAKTNLYALSSLLGEYLKHYGKSIHIFTTSGQEVINCWVGDLIKEAMEKRQIWDKEIEFKVKILANLDIGDFSDFASSHKEAIDVGVINDIIYYNLDAYKRRASEIWELILRKTNEKGRRFEPSRSNYLRKKLYYKSWAKLFEECKERTGNLKDAKTEFTEKTAILLQENNLYHELGHIFAQKYLGITDEADEEFVAFLTELRYGTLPYESLDILASSRWRSSRESYNFASDRILDFFLSYIKNEQQKGNLEYKGIVIESGISRKAVDDLYKLTDEQIRQISEEIYTATYKAKIHN